MYFFDILIYRRYVDADRFCYLPGFLACKMAVLYLIELLFGEAVAPMGTEVSVLFLEVIHCVGRDSDSGGDLSYRRVFFPKSDDGVLVFLS